MGNVGKVGGQCALGTLALGKLCVGNVGVGKSNFPNALGALGVRMSNFPTRWRWEKSLRWPTVRTLMSGNKLLTSAIIKLF